MIELSAVVRFVNLTASALLLGIFGFIVLIARPAYLEAPAGGKSDLLCFERFQYRTVRWCVITIFASALLGLWFQALYIGDPVADASTGLREAFFLAIQTRFGWVWLLKMGLLFVIACMVTWDTRSRGNGIAYLVSGL